MTEDIKPTQATGTEAMVEFTNAIKTILNRKNREDIRSVYANFATFEINDLDLKILFGQISQQAGKSVDLHMAVTMAWAEAKILSFFLRINLAIYEMQNGPIVIPTSMLPAPIPAPDETNTPNAQKTFDTLQAIHNELMEEQKNLREG